jgi:hypothetical protein
MNEIELAPGIKVTCNKGWLYKRGQWLEYTPQGAPKTCACGVKLMESGLEYVKKRVAELNAIMQRDRDSRYAGAVVTVEEA